MSTTTEKSSKPNPNGIAVGLDLGPASDTAFGWARELARTTRDPVHLVHAVSAAVLPAELGLDADEAIQSVRAQLAPKLEELRGHGLVAELHVDVASPARLLDRVTREENLGLLVLGSGDPTTARRFLLGSTIHRVAALPGPPVVTVPLGRRTEVPPRRILVGTDLSPELAPAIAEALRRLQLGPGSELLLLHAWSVPSGYTVYGPGGALAATHRQTEIESRLHEALARAGERLEAPPTVGVQSLLRQGDAADTIVETAGEFGADLVVVGSQGGSHWGDRLLGSVARSVVAQASCPVLLGIRAET